MVVLDRQISLSSTSEEERDPQEYATFLKERSRLCGPDGFLDSKRYQKSYRGRRNKGQDARESDRFDRPLSVVDLRQNQVRHSKEYDKRMKVIEDHMWQHKQEERELKRIEGDVIKNQQAVRRTLRDYEAAVSRKKMEENKKLNQGLEKYTKEQNQFIHKKEDQTKKRIDANFSLEQNQKETGRKFHVVTNDLARQYRSKMSELELRKIELGRISSEFEAKIKKKEEEQFRLKQELAELAISLNMEAQKGRQQVGEQDKQKTKIRVQRMTGDRSAAIDHENKQAKSEDHTKNAEMTRRKLSADLMLTRAHLQLKKREEGRHLRDTENRLRTNMMEQKNLTEAATQAELDYKAKKLQDNVREHENRKRLLAMHNYRQKKDKSEAHEAHYNTKFQKRFTDQQRREHEDHLKYFQKMVNRAEEREHSLFSRVRNAEYARQKQEQNVRKAQQELYEIKRQNAQKIKEEMTLLNKQEQELEQKLQREQAQLAKVHADREECYIKLMKHRELVREDKYLYDSHQREHERMLRVGDRSQQGAPLTT